MSTVQHYSILVTCRSYQDDILDRAHNKALEIFRNAMVSGINVAPVNGLRSFVIFPSGSHEGWDPANEFHEERESFLQWIDEQAFEDGSNSLEWVETSFGDKGVFGRTNFYCNDESEDPWDWKEWLTAHDEEGSVESEK
jgi:hypothetical protein